MILCYDNDIRNTSSMTPPSSQEIIHVILTGGTIDSFYNGIKDTATPRISSIIPSYFEMLRLYGVDPVY